MKHLHISLFSVPFSVNQISTLADFEDCERLQELYLRKNNIPDLSELAYIQVNKHAEINKKTSQCEDYIWNDIGIWMSANLSRLVTTALQNINGLRSCRLSEQCVFGLWGDCLLPDEFWFMLTFCPCYRTCQICGICGWRKILVWSELVQSKNRFEVKKILINKFTSSSYRMAVLRALPNLTKLDNVDVTPEEVNEALRAAVRREEPVYQEPYQEPPVPQQPQQRQQQAPPQQEYRQSSPIREVSLV